MKCPKCEAPVDVFMEGAAKKNYFCLQCRWKIEGLDEQAERGLRIQSKRPGRREWGPPFGFFKSLEEALREVVEYRRMFEDDEFRLVRLVEVDV